MKLFTFHDSPRRAHSIAAQGGINAAKNYQNDGDSIYRLFYDTVKGGDYRAREANVYRLAQVSVNIIDQCVAQGVPFAREYGGLLDNRSFGGAQVSRTFYARGQTGQQLLLGAYQALERQVALGTVEMYTRMEMLDLVLKEERAAGIVTRNLVTGAVQSWSAHAVVLATGGYGNAFYLSTNAKASNVTAAWRAHRKGALFANPCYTQIHPTCIPRSDDFQSKLTLMSESLRNDGRVWVPEKFGDERSPDQIPESERDYFLERRYPAFGNLVPRDVASRAAKREVDAGRGVGPLKNGVYLDLGTAITRVGKDVIEERYGNLIEMYERITDEDPYQVPMRIYPAVHYTMGGLWVDYNLMSNVPGLYVLGEANFSDHGANRLGASALMQGLADGYFVLPSTISEYLAPLLGTQPVSTDDPAFAEAESDVHDRVRKLTTNGGTRSVDHFHRELGNILWDNCGMARSRETLEKALGGDPRAARRVPRRRPRARRARVAQPVAREGRASGRLPRVRRAALPRRPPPRGVLRRSLPGRAPDRGRRGVAQRRRLLLRRRVGVHRGGFATGAPQGAARVRVRPPRPAQLQVGTGAPPVMDLKLRVWRQAGANAPGSFEDIAATDISPEMSFLEMFDVLNDRMVAEGREPIAFDHDCREGICGSCSMMINGRAHGPSEGTATCQLHMRKFKDGDEIVVEPWRARAFPIIRDLVVDRSAFDRIVEAGGYISAPTGSAPDANLILVPKEAADAAMDAAACIGCGACVAACPNGAAQLFTAAKVAHLSLLPQGQPERYRARRGNGGDDGELLRVVHQPRRVREGVPEGDQHRLHRPAEPRLREGAVQEPQARRPEAVAKS